MKKILIAVMSVGLALCGAAILAPVAMATSSICDDYNSGKISEKPPGCDTANANADFQTQVQVGINLVLGVAGLIAVAFIIYGGLKYTTSAGDAAKVTSAKNTILYAVIGLVVAGLAFAIVNFVIRGLRF